MRILCITPFPVDQPGPDGMTLIAYYLLRALAAKHQVTVWNSASYPLPGRLWKHYAHAHGLPWYAARHFAPRLANALQAEAQHYDLIYLHSPFSLGYAEYLSGTPAVVGVIDTMSDWFRQVAAFESNPLKRLHYCREQRLSANLEAKLLANTHIKKLIVVSPADKTSLGGNSQITVIPNGVDTETFRPDPHVQKQKAIIFTGVMNYRPNEDAVHYFYQQIWPHCRTPDLKWYIVGKQPSTAIQALAKRDTNIVVTGTVPTIVPYLQKATLYVAPVRFGTGIKNKLLEAMACGLPVVALPSSMGGLEPAPIRTAPPEQFAETITQLLREPETLTALGQAGRNYIEEFHTWNVVCSQYEQEFTSARLQL